MKNKKYIISLTIMLLVLSLTSINAEGNEEKAVPTPSPSTIDSKLQYSNDTSGNLKWAVKFPTAVRLSNTHYTGTQANEESYGKGLPLKFTVMDAFGSNGNSLNGESHQNDAVVKVSLENATEDGFIRMMDDDTVSNEYKMGVMAKWSDDYYFINKSNYTNMLTLNNRNSHTLEVRLVLTHTPEYIVKGDTATGVLNFKFTEVVK